MSHELTRIVAAAKTLQVIRDNIEKNGGYYSGAQVPNIQSVLDILAMPDADLPRALIDASKVLDCCGVSVPEKEALLSAWRGEAG